MKIKIKRINSDIVPSYGLMGLERDFTTLSFNYIYNVVDNKQFFLSVIQYGLEYEMI